MSLLSRHYVLNCRIDGCEKESGFDTTDEITESDWTEASALGVIKKGYMAHPAYCPGHSLEE